MLGILSVNSFVVHDGLEDGMDLIGWDFHNLVSDVWNSCVCNSWYPKPGTNELHVLEN